MFLQNLRAESYFLLYFLLECLFSLFWGLIYNVEGGFQCQCVSFLVLGLTKVLVLRDGTNRYVQCGGRRSRDRLESSGSKLRTVLVMPRSSSIGETCGGKEVDIFYTQCLFILVFIPFI